MERDFANYLSGKFGYTFRDSDLLRQALTHRSFGASHNERLEFLGDGVLDCIVAAELYARFPALAEGELSRLRASFVNQHSLVEAAQRFGLSGALRLGEGELKSGGPHRPSILADALEALIGAVFLDGGYGAARELVVRLFDEPLKNADPDAVDKDAKTLLQEFLQARHIALPRYSVIAIAGEAHNQTFSVECVIPELNIRTVGEGASRRRAEQIAARRAYELGARP
jgi:ribonuclease-3